MPRRPLTLSLHEDHPRHTLRADTGSVMRKTFLLLALLALSLPVAGLASLSAGDGTLSVEDGRGKVTIQARGGVIGRLDRGTVTIYDLTPEDANVPARLRRRPAGRAGRRERDQVHGGRHALPDHRRPLPHRDPGPRDRPLRRRQGLRLDQGRPRPVRRVLARRRRLQERPGRLQAAARGREALRARGRAAERQEKSVVRPAADG